MINFKNIKYIPGLDGFRAFAVLLVLVSHFGFKDIVTGGLGVTIFFFVSGFLITTLLINERQATGTVAIRDFYIRRALRLMPELLAMLLISSLLHLLTGHATGLGEWVAALTYTTNYYTAITEAGPVDVVLSWPQLWSLSVEEHFYISYPLIFAAWMTSHKRVAMVLTVLLGGDALYRYGLVHWVGIDILGVEHPYTYVASEARFDSIGYGVAFAFTCQSAWQIKRWQAALFACLGLVLLVYSLANRNPLFRETLRYSVQGIALYLVFTALYKASLFDWVFSILETPFLKRLGILSYAAYLWHWDYYYLTHTVLGVPLVIGSVPLRFLYMILGLGVSFALAEASYRLIAQRFQGLRHRFSPRPILQVEPIGN